MNINELITELQKLNGECMVYFKDYYSEEYYVITEVRLMGNSVMFSNGGLQPSLPDDDLPS